MNWYRDLNLLEAVIWWIVAATIAVRTPRKDWQQFWAVLLASVAFTLFGVSDVLEAYHQRSIPLWLWGLKCLCGVGIFSSRYLWRGWNTFRWTDREFLFGLGCLLAVIILILLQHEYVILPYPEF